jgi:hypothetical protein
MLDPQIREDEPALTRRTLRQFGGICLIFFSGLAFWQRLAGVGPSFSLVSPAAVLTAVALVFGFVGLARPEALRPIYIVLRALTYPVGRVVSLILLGTLFYGVFTPLALFFKLAGRDVLERHRPEKASYWSPKPAVKDLRSYLRQS